MTHPQTAGGPPSTSPEGDSRLVTPAASAMHVRDVPASCICLWEWNVKKTKWDIVKLLPGCPWHEGG